VRVEQRRETERIVGQQRGAIARVEDDGDVLPEDMNLEVTTPPSKGMGQ
jgi:hypothetical protein